jgi:transcriptional regulator GlxA family with amidase domain
MPPNASHDIRQPMVRPDCQPANDTGPHTADSAIKMRLLQARPWTAVPAELLKRRETYCSRLAPWQLRRVTDFMRDNLPDTLQLAQLAAISGLSPSHFGRAFKGSTGLPPHRWHLNLRIERARAMLTDAGASLADVACATGFADQSHFTRVFSKIVGTSPGAWRRAQAI